jgi:two-component system cell cycle sensor histidine kinase/response regulator CckA
MPGSNAHGPFSRLARTIWHGLEPSARRVSGRETSRRERVPTVESDDAELTARAVAVIQSIPLGIALLEADGTVAYANAELARQLRLETFELKNQPFDQFIDPSDGWPALKDGSVVGAPTFKRLVQRDGTLIWGRMRIAELPWHDGGSSLRILCVDDVTAEKSSEAECRARAALLEMAGDAVMVRDIAGHIEYFNRSAEELFECERERARGGMFDEVTRVLDKTDYDAADRTLLNRGEWIGELRHELPSGRSALLHERWTLLYDQTGVPRSVLNISTDVTDLKAREREQQLARRLESLGRLAGGIAHDFNNLLTVILGNASLAVAELASDHIVQTRLRDITTAGERASDIVRGILKFNASQDMRRVAVDVASVVREAVTLLGTTKPAEVQLELDIAQGLPVVQGDPTGIHQVIMNLLTNGIAAMDGRGKLSVRVTRVRADAQTRGVRGPLQAGEYVCISVKDTGCGIDKQVMERIFEPFFTTKGVGKGTGLGLSLAHGIVQSHGGDLAVESKPGHGAEFRVYLPSAEFRAPLEQRSAEAQIRRGAGERIALIDDEPAVLALMERMLQLLNYEPIAFHEPREAVQVICAAPFEYAALVVDLLMPHMSGIELARAVRLARADVPIGMISGYFSQDDLSAARELGIRSLLQKPPSLDQFSRFVHGLLSAAAVPASAG